MNKKSKNVKIEHSPRLFLTTRRTRCWCIIEDDHHGECDDEDVQCLAALPHSPLLAPTKCDRWGGNLGDPPCPLPPLYPPSLPSHLAFTPRINLRKWRRVFARNNDGSGSNYPTSSPPNFLLSSKGKEIHFWFWEEVEKKQNLSSAQLSA